MVRLLNGAFKPVGHKPADLKMFNFLFRSKTERASKFLKPLQVSCLQVKPAGVAGNALKCATIPITWNKSQRVMTGVILDCMPGREGDKEILLDLQGQKVV